MELYETIFYSAKVNKLFTNDAVISYMLQFERALAQAQGMHNVIPGASAIVIDTCCKVENINKDQLIAEASPGGNINIPLVKQLTAVVKQHDTESARYVHLGATSQDVIDTAIMLQCRDAVTIITEDLKQLIGQLASLVEKHRNTIMTGRSFMQHARPVTFGYKVAGWLDALLRSRKETGELLKEGFVLQFGGAVGTLSGMREHGLTIAETMSKSLHLNNPSKPWHTERDYVVTIATTLGMLAGNIGKIAKDISLLMQTEIAEVFEPPAPGKGRSSTMPHKRNPVGCIVILANCARIPSLVSTMLSCMTQDHERATGLWHAEWETLADIVKLTAGIVSKSVELTDGLEVNSEKMLINLELTNGLIYAENVSFALAEKIGKAGAHELIDKCCKDALSKKIHLKTVLAANEEIKNYLSAEQISFLLNPANSLGLAEQFIQRVLDAV